MEIGAALTIITPEVPMTMAGYSARHGASHGTHDELKARAIYFAHEGVEIALVVCDLLGMVDEVVTEIREECEKVLGIPAGNIMLSATHTHQGPAGLARYMDQVYPPNPPVAASVWL